MPQSLFQGVARAADGTRLAVQTRGEGPALLLLAGQANNHHWWDLVRADFAAERTTITFDYRGTGASEFRDMPCSTRQFAQDAVAVLDYVGVASADVYGTSMGGRVATWVAVDAPRRLRRLILGLQRRVARTVSSAAATSGCRWWPPARAPMCWPT